MHGLAVQAASGASRAELLRIAKIALQPGRSEKDKILIAKNIRRSQQQSRSRQSGIR
jgi:hypothetical protein